MLTFFNPLNPTLCSDPGGMYLSIVYSLTWMQIMIPFPGSCFPHHTTALLIIGQLFTVSICTCEHVHTSVFMFWNISVKAYYKPLSLRGEAYVFFSHTYKIHDSSWGNFLVLREYSQQSFYISYYIHFN